MTVLCLVAIAPCVCPEKGGLEGADFLSIEQISETVLPGAGCFFVKFVCAQHDASLYIFCPFLVSTPLFAAGVLSSKH